MDKGMIHSFEQPHRKLIGSISKVSESAKMISTHWFNKQVEVILPHADNDLKSIKTHLKKTINPFYYTAKGPLQLLFEESFLDAHIRQGKFYAFSHLSRIDRGNSFAILPTGKLYLALDKETFEQLGLEAKKSSFPPKDQRYNVIIDLRAPSFKPGKKFYERVQWCFTDRIDPVSFLCFWVNDGTTQEIRFPAKFESKRMEIACSDETQPPVNCPDFVDIMKTFAVNHKIEEDDETILDDLMMWLGLVHTRSLSAIRTDKPPVHSYVLNYQPYFPLVPGNVSTLKWSGIVPPETVGKLAEDLRKYVQDKSLPWAILTCWGFPDSPVSWNEFEHGFFFSGENDFTMIILPNDTCYNLISLGPLDAFT